jgi:hypothetical protein
MYTKNWICPVDIGKASISATFKQREKAVDSGILTQHDKQGYVQAWVQPTKRIWVLYVNLFFRGRFYKKVVKKSPVQ